ncbi:putative rhomboid protease RBD2 SCDLUD_001164 [Saccharomycodes ludwigii]|uniref:putative rhomboid protease RBD2 n=1 Tax=Saccharomycodes ludwigii TaxID=36035 RepID=UPI001E890287|nr:hypothetical protein SCDLUD_001164 [Saccharomycodes ludwigii]KAH3903523.1 hypothetical protein SCDLUD_001164 [Saccharomycodes ludwigii]
MLSKIGGIRFTAITSGLIIFLWIVFLFMPIAPFSLNEEDLFDLKKFGHLSLYPLQHASILHILFNSIALFSLLSLFEREKGTIRTGVLLNLFAVIAGIFYCLLERSFSFIIHRGESSTVQVVGSSGWWFTLFTWYCCTQSANFNETNSSAISSDEDVETTATTNNILYNIRNIFNGNNVTTITIFGRSFNRFQLLPFLMLFFISVIFFGQASFLGHLCGIITGYLYYNGQKIFDHKLCIPSKLISKFESLGFWYGSSDMSSPTTSSNGNGYLLIFLKKLSIEYFPEHYYNGESTASVLPTVQPSIANAQNENFTSSGRVLGSN